MRTRSYQATLAAALVLGAGMTASRAETDSFWSDLDTPAGTGRGAAPADLAPFERAPADLAPSELAPVKVAPMKLAPTKRTPAVNEPMATSAVDVKAAGSLDTTPTQSIAPHSAAAVPDVSSLAAETLMKPRAVANPVKVAPAKAEGHDPEPDVAIKAPTHLSDDPLDGLTPPQANPAGADPGGEAATKPVPAQEPLAPLNAALKAAIDKRDSAEIKGPHAAMRRKEREALAFFYAARGFAPIWSADGMPVAAVEPVLARLAKAGDDALTLTAVPKALIASGTPAEIADSELALSEGVFSYARQAAGSRVDPLAISPLIGLKRELADPSEALEAVAAAGVGAGDKLRAFNPVDPRYVALRDRLEALRTGQEAPPSAAIPAGPTLTIGMHDERVPMLRAHFGIEPSLEPDDDPTRYDGKLAAAVKAFQRDNGLAASGTLTKRTVAALGGGAHPSRRQEGTIIATMEMWRWMPRTLGPNRIEVNVPDYLVTIFKDGAVDARHRVVVGKTDTPTPLFANAMKYLIVNPYWNVPQSIIKKEMLPKGGGSLDYLDGRGYSVSYKGGVATVKQLPGDKNALGRIKFLFPNDYSVYLHDTPSKALFAASKRAFSHGCVRVDQPFAFAESVLNDAAPASSGKHWSEDKLEDMIGDKERYINLAQPLPIVIEYFTASVEPDTGTLKLREDVYGYTHAVATALGQDSEPAPEQHKPEQHKPEHHKPAPLVAERAPRRAVAARRFEREKPEPSGPRTADAAPSPLRSLFGGIFDPR